MSLGSPFGNGTVNVGMLVGLRPGMNRLPLVARGLRPEVGLKSLKPPVKRLADYGDNWYRGGL